MVIINDISVGMAHRPMTVETRGIVRGETCEWQLSVIDRTFTEILCRTGVGRLPPIGNPASARISVAGNGNSIPNSDEGTDSKSDFSNWRETTQVSQLK